jgi:hypothetical protein
LKILINVVQLVLCTTEFIDKNLDNGKQAMKHSKYLIFMFLGTLHNQVLDAYRGAGVLPYAFDAQGDIQVLVGSSSVHKGTASDFGGLKDDIDAWNPLYTAAREGCEELMFIFDSTSSFEELIKGRNCFGKDFNLLKAQSASYAQILAKLTPNTPHTKSNDYYMYFVGMPL